MTDQVSVHAVVYGRVHGVYFRAFVAQRAAELGLKGYVRNLPGGNAIEVEAEGDQVKLEKLVSHLHAGPPRANVEKVVTGWAEFTGKYSRFEVRY